LLTYRNCWRMQCSCDSRLSMKKLAGVCHERFNCSWEWYLGIEMNYCC
jgi:hypothetical protein